MLNRIKAVIQEFAKHAKIPGFRQGKAPANIVRSKFSKDMAEELNRQVLARAYEYMTKETDLAVLNVVELDEESRTFKLGEPGNIRFTVDLEPEFELPEYKGVEVSVEKKEVEEKEVDETFE